MIAGAYLRKSNDEPDKSEGVRSVDHQLVEARRCAAERGWVFNDRFVFCDDGVSGAEFNRKKRPELYRLFDALEPRPPFDVLIVEDQSRLGRDPIRTLSAIQQITEAGVKIHSTLDDKEITLDEDTDEIQQFITSWANARQRRDTGKKIFSRLKERAEAGWATSRPAFGYRHREVLGPDGKRHHVEREVNPDEAPTVRRVFELWAGGVGLLALARRLNDEGAPAPMPSRRKGQPRAWTPSALRALLGNPLYKGVTRWGVRESRRKKGKRIISRRPEARIEVEVPSLRIVDPELWAQAQRRFQPQGPLSRPQASRYLLSGYGECPTCGGGLFAWKRSSRRVAYRCSRHHLQGRSACDNGMTLPQVAADEAVISALIQQITTPEVVERAVKAALASLVGQGATDDPHPTPAPSAEIAQVEREIGHLTQAIAAGGDLPSLVVALRAKESRLAELKASQGCPATSRAKVSRLDVAKVRKSVRARLDDLTAALKRNPEEARVVLASLLASKITFYRAEEPGKSPALKFRAKGKLSALVGGPMDSVKHPVHDHPRDRHVEPEGEGDAREPDVSVKAGRQGAEHGHQSERNDDHGEDRVCGEDREVQDTDPSLPREPHRANLNVIGQVRSEEEDGDGEGRSHAELVGQDLAPADAQVARHEEDGAGRVERGVEGGQGREPRGTHVTPGRHRRPALNDDRRRARP